MGFIAFGRGFTHDNHIAEVAVHHMGVLRLCDYLALCGHDAELSFFVERYAVWRAPVEEPIGVAVAAVVFLVVGLCDDLFVRVDDCQSYLVADNGVSLCGGWSEVVVLLAQRVAVLVDLVVFAVFGYDNHVGALIDCFADYFVVLHWEVLVALGVDGSPLACLVLYPVAALFDHECLVLWEDDGVVVCVAYAPELAFAVNDVGAQSWILDAFLDDLSCACVNLL